MFEKNQFGDYVYKVQNNFYALVPCGFHVEFIMLLYKKEGGVFA